MDAYRTEDEQVEALKRWWKENGTSTVLSIVVVFGGYFAWQAWQTRQETYAESASINYQQLVQLAAQIEQEPTETRYATAQHLAETLKADYADTEYARYAALLQARLQVSQQDLEGAEAELRWVLASAPEPALEQVSNLRLARVLFAAGQADQALALSNSVEYGEFAAAFHELRGDIYYEQGDTTAAREQYQSALARGAGDANTAPLVKMKLESLPRDPSENGDDPEQDD